MKVIILRAKSIIFSIHWYSLIFYTYVLVYDYCLRLYVSVIIFSLLRKMKSTLNDQKCKWKKKKQKSLFLSFILIKSTGGYITFEDSKWFHRKKFKLILLLIFNKLRRKKVLNIGKFKSKFYHQTSLTFFSKRDKSYIFLSNHQPFLTFFLISRIIFLLVQQQYYLQNNSQIYSESSPFWFNDEPR